MAAALDLAADPFADVFGHRRTGRRHAAAGAAALPIVDENGVRGTVVYVPAGTAVPYDVAPEAPDLQAGSGFIGERIDRNHDRVAFFFRDDDGCLPDSLDRAAVSHLYGGLAATYWVSSIVWAGAEREVIGFATRDSCIGHPEVDRIAAWVREHR